MLTWYKCQGAVWCELKKLDISHKLVADVKGVYIVWYGADNNRSVLRVGGGEIENEIKALHKDPAIMAFTHFGLYITWASVPTRKIEGIVCYLAQKLSPKLMKVTPKGIPVPVELPWVIS